MPPPCLFRGSKNLATPNGIESALQLGLRHGSSTVLVKDIHLPELTAEAAASLPSALQLKALGISKVLYGIERNPFVEGVRVWPGRGSGKIENWLTQLHGDRMPVVWDGLDVRPLLDVPSLKTWFK